MSIKLAILKNVKHRPTKVVAQCPACFEAGADKTGNHLVVYPDGKFGCTANPRDKAHRQRIAQLAGDLDRKVAPWTLKLRGEVVMSGGQPHPAAGTPIASLARSSVKRSANTPSEPSAAAFSDNTDACNTSTHCTRNISHSDPVRIGLPCIPSEASENTPCVNALTTFDGKVVAIIAPDAIVPGRFRDVLATWTPTRNHPGLQGYIPRRLSGWTRRGQPIYRR